MTLYALDPGPERSGLVHIVDSGEVTGKIWPNRDLLAALRRGHGAAFPAHLVIEQVECYGMPVGQEVFSTVFFAGQCAEAWQSHGLRASWSMLPQRTVKLTLCGSARAKDPNIRQALIDRYGGPACAKKGGALAGIKSHLWSALALAVTYEELQQQEALYGEAQAR